MFKRITLKGVSVKNVLSKAASVFIKSENYRQEENKMSELNSNDCPGIRGVKDQGLLA